MVVELTAECSGVGRKKQVGFTIPGSWESRQQPGTGITSGRLFRRVNRAGRIWGESMTEKVVWHVVREFATKAGIEKLAPHDLREAVPCSRR